jgi:hypothetical protein
VAGAVGAEPRQGATGPADHSPELHAQEDSYDDHLIGHVSAQQPRLGRLAADRPQGGDHVDGFAGALGGQQPEEPW